MSMTLYAIRLSKRKKEEDFEAFMKTEIFPAVDKSSLRSGQVSKLLLWKGNNTGRTNEYILLVYGTVNGGSVNAHLSSIKAFGAKVKPMHEYADCVKWEANESSLS